VEDAWFSSKQIVLERFFDSSNFVESTIDFGGRGPTMPILYSGVD
jgi:hypothetical protein